MGEGANRVTTSRPAAPEAAELPPDTSTLAISVPFLSNAPMADGATFSAEPASDKPDSAALQHRHWRMALRLSSGAQAIDDFLCRAAFDRAPWLAVGFAGGIAAWFLLANAWQWLAFIAGGAGLAVAGLALGREGRYPFLQQALLAMGLIAAAGCLTVWAKSSLTGARPIARPVVATLVAKVLARQEQPAENRVRLILAIREPGSERPIRVRVNLPSAMDSPAISRDARLRLKVRLMPPAPPMLPGGYDFARKAWFSGLSASGSVVGKPIVLEPGRGSGLFGDAQASLSRRVRDVLPGASGTIAATLASGDRGAISPEDDKAMRNSGLAHLLSISGLHVSALVGATYLVCLRLLAFWPWLALRVRLPIVAAGIGALAGIGYTLLTGAEVPTVRSCIGALLVLAALALGREALSLRMLAVAAFCVMILWPESVTGPSFQMSFSAVIAIIALHRAAPVRAFLAPREESPVTRLGRQACMLLVTGIVIELALMPIGLFHFHRSGVYGALANVIAIPLTTFVTMPAIALAIVLDVAGLGWPAWWLAGQSIDAMLALAHFVSSRPGAVTLVPAMSFGSIVLLVGGGLWLALWQGRVGLAGLVPVLGGAIWLAQAKPPDLLVSGDGRQVAIIGETGNGMLMLRQARSSYVADKFNEAAGAEGGTTPLATWSGADCSADFCTVILPRGDRAWRLLISRGKDMVDERALAAACALSDIAISDRWLPRSCRPIWIKADRAMLRRTGGLAIDLERKEIETVASGQGQHGWWNPDLPRRGQRRCRSAPCEAKASKAIGPKENTGPEAARPERSTGPAKDPEQSPAARATR